MSAFTATQRAELRDAVARSMAEAHAEHQRRARLSQERKAAERAEARSAAPKPKRRRKRDPLPPKTAQLPAATRNERELADRLLPHIVAVPGFNRDRHALCIARTVIDSQRRNPR